MNTQDASLILEQRIELADLTVSDLTVPQGMRLMLDFYQDVRVNNCKVEEDGDMLLFEWGIFSFGQAPTFQCSITRQLMEPISEDYDALYQLSLRFHFFLSAHLEALECGNRWCQSPHELPDFEAFVLGSNALYIIQTMKPSMVGLTFNQV